MNSKIKGSVYEPLHWTYGLVPFLAGLDKFFNLLTNWESYLSGPVSAILPFSPATFMHLVGLIEMLVGLAVLSHRGTRIGAYAVTVWLLAIAGNLVLLGRFDVAVRDLAMAVGAYTLARLTEIRESVEVVESERLHPPLEARPLAGS